MLIIFLLTPWIFLGVLLGQRTFWSMNHFQQLSFKSSLPILLGQTRTSQEWTSGLNKTFESGEKTSRCAMQFDRDQYFTEL